MSRTPVDRGQLDPACAARWHGTPSAYRHGCRCDHARNNHRIYQKRYRQRRAQPAYIDATGTARRIRALSALGWRFVDIAERYGDISYQAIQKIALMDRPRVHRITADRIKAVYDDMSMTPGPSLQTRTRAARKGWCPPLAWDEDTIDDPTKRPRIGNPARAGACDDVAVLRAVTGDGDAAVRDVDRREAVRLLASARVPDADIADRLGTTPAAVKQLRYRHGMTRGRAGVAA